MKRRVLLAGFAIALFSASTQLFAITIQNSENAVFYYVVYSGSVPDLQALKATPQAIVQYLLSHNKDLAYVPPAGLEPNVDVGSQPAAILGFFVRPGESAYPVSATYVSPSQSEAAFAVGTDSLVSGGTGDGKLLTISSIEVPPTSEPVVIDNRYLDWLKVPTLARFASYYVPRHFVQQANGERTELPIDKSLFYGKGGTQIEYFKAIRSNNYLYLLLSSTTELSPGLSYLFYLYRDRTAGSGDYTVEIPVDRKSGLVVLWEKGKSKPQVVGDFTHSIFFLEARIRLDELPAALNDPGLSIDLATTMHDSGIREEFYFSTLFARDIPR